MTAESTLTVRSPAELIAAVPYLIGFHPADSVTVLALRRGMVIFAARVDLPPPGATPSDPLHLATVAGHQGADAAAIVGYGQPARVTPAVLATAGALGERGIAVLDILRVTGGRFWSYRCRKASASSDFRLCGESCACGGQDGCPTDGWPCESGHSAVAAAATYAGHVALPDREALVGQLAPVEGDERDAAAAASERALDRLADLLIRRARGAESLIRQARGAESLIRRAPGAESLIRQAPGADLLFRHAAGANPSSRRAPGTEPATGRTSVAARLIRRAGHTAVRDAERRYRSGGRLLDDEIAWLGLLLIDLDIRDYAWERTRDEDWRLALWTDVLRRVQPEYVPAPACLLGFAAWRAGLGALARAAVERALAQDPEYRMALLITEILASGMSPAAVDGWPALDRRAGDRDGGHRDGGHRDVRNDDLWNGDGGHHDGGDRDVRNDLWNSDGGDLAGDRGAWDRVPPGGTRRQRSSRRHDRRARRTGRTPRRRIRRRAA